MIVEVRVQAHPSRSEMAETLASELRGRVVYDPDPDSELRSPWRTYRAALEQPLDPKVTHLLVIQDDASPCEHLADVLPAIVAAREGFITLYVGGMPRLSAMAITRACYAFETFAAVRTHQWCPAIALIWPVEVIRPALEWVDEQPWPRVFTADDEILGRVARGLDVPVWATVPSLVDHPDNVTSIVGNKRAMGGRNPARCAHLLIEPDCDVRDYDW